MANICYGSLKKASILINGMERPLKLILSKLFNKIPEPTKEEIDNPVGQYLIELRDWFLEQETNEGYKDLWRCFWNVAIIKTQDAYYRHRIQMVIKRVKETDLDFRGKETGHPFWRD